MRARASRDGRQECLPYNVDAPLCLGGTNSVMSLINGTTRKLVGQALPLAGMAEGLKRYNVTVEALKQKCGGGNSEICRAGIPAC